MVEIDLALSSSETLLDSYQRKNKLKPNPTFSVLHT